MSARSTALVLLAVLPACALFGKSEPLTPSFYDPESPATSESAASVRDEQLRLRLGNVFGGTHLRERIVFRRSTRELGLYEERRWTERPEVYLRRALSRVLFEQRPVSRAISGVAPTLDVELTAFEELLAPRHAVRVSARVSLLDQRRARLERTFTVELPVAAAEDPRDFAPVADAIATALERCVAQIADAVVRELEAMALPTAGADAAAAPAGAAKQ